MCVCSAGIRSCSPGGIIVYSTCSLSPVQNDGVIAATLEHIWHHTGIEVVVEDIRSSMECFARMFKFFNDCKYGNLVLPNLVSNFGPMYFCRIRRISWNIANNTNRIHYCSRRKRFVAKVFCITLVKSWQLCNMGTSFTYICLSLLWTTTTYAVWLGRLQ